MPSVASPATQVCDARKAFHWVNLGLISYLSSFFAAGVLFACGTGSRHPEEHSAALVGCSDDADAVGRQVLSAPVARIESPEECCPTAEMASSSCPGEAKSWHEQALQLPGRIPGVPSGAASPPRATSALVYATPCRRCVDLIGLGDCVMLVRLSCQAVFLLISHC
jgi:hypothetical protein